MIATAENSTNNTMSPTPPMRGYYRPGVGVGEVEDNSTNENPTVMAIPTSSSTYVSNDTTMSAQPKSVLKNVVSPYNVPSTGLIRLSLSKPMGIVFEPMVDIHDPTQQRGVRICELPPQGAAVATLRLQLEDELLSINDKTVSRLTFDQVMDILLDAPPDKVDLLFRRPKRVAVDTTTSHTRSHVTTAPTTIAPTLATHVIVGDGAASQEKKRSTSYSPTPPPTTAASANAPSRLVDKKQEKWNPTPRNSNTTRQHHRILEEDSGNDDDDEDDTRTQDMLDQSTYDESVSYISSVTGTKNKRHHHSSSSTLGEYELGINFLDHLIDSICSPILGDAGNGVGGSHRSTTRKKSNTKYRSNPIDEEEEEEEDEDEEKDLSYTDDGTNYTEEDEEEGFSEKYRRDRRKNPVSSASGVKGRNRQMAKKGLEDEDDEEDSLTRDFRRGRSSSKTTNKNLNKPSISANRKDLSGYKDTHDPSHTRDRYSTNNLQQKNHRRISSSHGMDEPETIHESEYEDEEEETSFRKPYHTTTRGKSSTPTLLLKKSSSSSENKQSHNHITNVTSRRSKSPLPTRHKEILVNIPKNIASSLDKGLNKSKSMEEENNIPIKVLEYDDRLDADVSVMDSVGGPSIVLDNQRRTYHRNQESNKRSPVSVEMIVRYGQNYPYDLGFTREEFIQSNPLKFYRFVVCEILKKQEPEKLRLVSKLMEKYKDREEHLIEKLIARYQSNTDNGNGSHKQLPSLKESSDDWDTMQPVKRYVDIDHSQQQQQQQQQQRLKEQQRNDDGFEKFNAFPSIYFDSDSKDVFGFDPWQTSVETSEDSAIPNNVVDVEYDDTNTNSSYTESDYDSIDGTSPVVIAQVSDLINYVYGNTTVVGQIDRVSTIMKAYEGREAVLLELLETKALIKANSKIDPGSMEDLPSCIRDNPAFQKEQTQQQQNQQQQVGGNHQSPISNITMSTTSSAVTNNVAHGHGGPQQKTVSSIARSPNTPPQVGKTKSGLFGFLSGKKSKKGSPTGGAFPSKEGKMKADRVKQNDIKPTHSSDRSV